VKQTRLMMGMPITLEIVDASANDDAFNTVFDYFQYVDETFSTYKADSEIMRINRQELTLEDASQDMQTIFALADQTRQETYGYFDIRHNRTIDPSGIVKGWAIYNAAELLRRWGYLNFYVDAGGDIQVVGKNDQDQDWQVGIRNPFNIHEIVKVLSVTDCGVATSGTSIRGQHIYNPKNAAQTIDDIVGITVIGPNVYEADRFATAAFAMGKAGIVFIENLPGFEGYMIDANGIATLTTGFTKVVSHA
jgi:thiamine biosynthesis lipoprotein